MLLRNWIRTTSQTLKIKPNRVQQSKPFLGRGSLHALAKPLFVDNRLLVANDSPPILRVTDSLGLSLNLGFQSASCLAVYRVRRISRQQLDRSSMFRVCRIQSRRVMVWPLHKFGQQRLSPIALGFATELLQADVELLTARCDD